MSEVVLPVDGDGERLGPAKPGGGASRGGGGPVEAGLEGGLEDILTTVPPPPDGVADEGRLKRLGDTDRGCCASAAFGDRVSILIEGEDELEESYCAASDWAILGGWDGDTVLGL